MPYPHEGEVALQRLFTTFAGGWPGVGLLIQRIITGIALLIQGTLLLRGISSDGLVALDIAGAALGIFILLGLWTPSAGVLVAAVESWIALTGTGDPWPSFLLAVLGATLAMIGPGAWSIDARLFGRKHIRS